MVVEQPKMLHPGTIARLMGVMVVDVEVQYLRHFHSREQPMSAVRGSISHQPVTSKEPKPLVVGDAGH